jgi:hypothetical protein
LDWQGINENPGMESIIMDLDYVYIPLGLFIAMVALFKRELLVQRKSFTVILSVTVILFIAGVILHFSEGNRESSCGALLAPLLTLGFYRGFRRLFLRLHNHEPRDTYLNWAPSLGEDRIFNIVFFIGTFLLCMVTSIGMMKLARAGW